MTTTTTTTTTMMMMMMIRSTLGVSIVLCNHRPLRPDTVWSNSYHNHHRHHHHHHHYRTHRRISYSLWSSSYLHRTTYKSDATDCSMQTSSNQHHSWQSKCSNQILWKYSTNTDQRLSSTVCHYAVISAIHHSWQSSHFEDPHVYERRLLHVLVAVCHHGSGAVFRQLVQAAVCSRVHSNVAGKHQQCRQRVHLFFDKHTV